MPKNKTENRRRPVVTSDERRIGFANWSLGNEEVLRVTCMKGGCGYDHQVPRDWVAEVGECVYLNKTKAFVATNWQPWPGEARRPGRIKSGAGM